MEFIRELWQFLAQRKKLWMVPIVLIVLAVGGLLVIAEGSAIAPFIYTLF